MTSQHSLKDNRDKSEKSTAKGILRSGLFHQKRLQKGPERQWIRTWRKFRRSKIALTGAVIIGLFYIVCFFFPEFFAPYSLEYFHSVYLSAPPQVPRFVDSEGRFHWRPFVYGFRRVVDPVTFKRHFELDTSQRYYIHFFVRGEPYKIWGLFRGNIRFIGTEDGHMFLFGTDRLGRDLFSRVIYGGRISLAIGLLGVFLTILLGSVLGTVAGYYGGGVDNLLMRLTEVIMSFPSLPLWMALGAALPPGFSPIKAFFGITLIIGVLASAGLTREIRGKVLALREEEFVLAARGIGAGNMRIIGRHLLPNCMSHIIVVATLSIPGMILAETALSFLGLGLRPPMTSWGVLLTEAQHVRVLAHSPWLLIPAFFVIMAILAFNFLGDGLRDALDPYTRD